MPFTAEFPISLPSDSAASESGLDHYAAALDRLAEYLRGKTNVAGLLAASMAGKTELEQAIVDIGFFRVIDNAFGQGLDNLGAIVGQPRQSLGDDDYRLYIKAKIRANLSSGTIENVYAVADTIKPDGASLALVDRFPAAFTLDVGDVATPAATAAAMVQFMRTSRPGGVRGILKWGESAPEDLFRLDSGPGLDQGKFGGAKD